MSTGFWAFEWGFAQYTDPGLCRLLKTTLTVHWHNLGGFKGNLSTSTRWKRVIAYASHSLQPRLPFPLVARWPLPLYLGYDWLLFQVCHCSIHQGPVRAVWEYCQDVATRKCCISESNAYYMGHVRGSTKPCDIKLPDYTMWRQAACWLGNQSMTCNWGLHPGRMGVKAPRGTKWCLWDGKVADTTKTSWTKPDTTGKLNLHHYSQANKYWFATFIGAPRENWMWDGCQNHLW